jgi:hypothetical protein
LAVLASLRYIQVYEMLTGEEFVPAEYPAEPRVINALREL